MTFESRTNPSTIPANDPATRRWVPATSVPLDPGRVQSLLAAEWERFLATTPGSRAAQERASAAMPLGVPSSFQWWDPYPISIESARGAYLYDSDGRQLLDMSMGFGAMLVGHLHPKVVEAVKKQLDTGTLFVTPSPSATSVAERFQQRFDLDLVRFANSGTEAVMYAIRLARAFTGRSGIVKMEGGYHGGYDPCTVSIKPDLALAGPDDAPVPVVGLGIEPGELYISPYNNLVRLEQLLSQHQIAAVFMEPVLENISIVLPDEGYLAGVRALCDKYGTVLIFDEVKTGLTAGYSGASQRVGVKPDLVTLAKSIGGGLPLAAFGGRADIMSTITDWRMPHFGTYNGNPLVMAAAAAVDEICTHAELEAAEARNNFALDAIDEVIREFELPAHTVGFGVKGATTWLAEPVRNYRDYKKVDLLAAELNWLWGVNRGILTPPGLDEQWLVSLAHTEADMKMIAEDFRELAVALRA